MCSRSVNTKSLRRPINGSRRRLPRGSWPSTQTGRGSTSKQPPWGQPSDLSQGWRRLEAGSSRSLGTAKCTSSKRHRIWFCWGRSSIRRTWILRQRKSGWSIVLSTSRRNYPRTGSRGRPSCQSGAPPSSCSFINIDRLSQCRRGTERPSVSVYDDANFHVSPNWYCTWQICARNSQNPMVEK